MPASPATVEIPIRRVAEVDEETLDSLAVEEPLEIRLGLLIDGKRATRAISITMRTPGSDHELAAGFLFTEGIIKSPSQITAVRHCGPSLNGNKQQNTVLVELADDVGVDLGRLARHFYTSSSCGVCGKTSIEALRTGATEIDSDLRVAADVVNTLPRLIRESQAVFESTGGLHASALFTGEGDLEVVREDVGRHNALDKVIGAKFMSGQLPLSDSMLLVSGRASFELVQKACMAGIPIMAAVGAPSSLAVELAREYGMTLAGFVRDGSFNIYAGGERIT